MPAPSPTLSAPTLLHMPHFAMIEHASVWFVQNWADLLVAVVAAFLIDGLLNLLIGWAKAGCQRGASHTPILGVIARALKGTRQTFIMLAAIRIVIGFVDLPPALHRALVVAFTIIAVIQGALWVRQIILGFIELRTQEETVGAETLANASGLIRVLVTVAVFVIAAIVVLDNLGVNVTGLVAGLGIGGIAIGLAAQGIFSDLFAALSILFDRPFRVGETISFDGSAATVEKIGLKSTRMRMITGEKRIVSNANLLNKDLISYAGLDRRRIKFIIGLIYQTNPDAAERVPDILKEIVEAHDATFVRAGFTGFGASSLDYDLEFDVMSGNWDEVFGVRHKVGLAILKRFNALKLSFAYPTQTTFTSDPDGNMIMPYPSDWVPPHRES